MSSTLHLNISTQDMISLSSIKSNLELVVLAGKAETNAYASSCLGAQKHGNSLH